MHSAKAFISWPQHALLVLIVCGPHVPSLFGQRTLPIDSAHFRGVLHDNVSNQQRQGSGLSPLQLKSFPGKSLYRDDAVGMNFEHIFNGTKAQHAISMFTPRQDRCRIKQLGKQRFELHWPSKDSQWHLDARMIYDFSAKDQIDLTFQCTPTSDLYPQKFAAMMWASYMHTAHDRRIHFWGTDGKRRGWMTFGDGTGKDIEVGTVAHAKVPNLSYEEGAQTLNLIEHPHKKFITPFYYGLLDGDHNLNTKDDTLIYLVLFDQTSPIRFAMWNFFKDEEGLPDTHSPAWDWQYVITHPEIGRTYGYRARIVVKPFQGSKQLWAEYRRWMQDLQVDLPQPPATQ